jgi:lipoyl(octanoyl) transferase
LELRKAGRIENVLLLLEHPPVITLGRNAEVANVLASPEFLEQRGVELFEIDRGGDVTFHGPGQLVAYPIFDLRSFEPKIGAVEFVRRLEEVLIRICGDFGISTQRIKGMTGVWTYALRNKPEAKIAAIGVHISRGVTTHGFALNVSNDLEYFDLIIPCGLTGKPVTSMERELQKTVSVNEVATAASRNFGRVFQSQMLWLESLDDLLGQASEKVAGTVELSAPAAANQDTPARPPKELRELHGDGSELA